MTAIEFSEQLMGMEPSLLKYASRFKLDHTDSQDLVQETFLKAILNRDKFTDNGFFKAWTYTIMRNTFINNYRHNVLHNIHPERIDESLSARQIISQDSYNPDSSFSVNEINQEIGKLKDNFREPFQMYLAGYKYREIADAINLNIGTVKSRIFLAKKLLMHQLES
jgi:RNA polymerase sigma-70 factor, ECF subfamily